MTGGLNFSETICVAILPPWETRVDLNVLDDCEVSDRDVWDSN